MTIMDTTLTANPPRFVVHANTSSHKQVARLVLSIVIRHKLAVILSVVASLVVAAVFAKVFGSQTWEASGTMVYSPLVGSDSSNSLYVSPDLKTLVTLIKARGNLDAIRKEFKLEVPTEMLNLSFKVIVPNGTKTIDFSIRWGKSEIAAGMVNRLMELARENVASVRRERINGFVDSFEAHLAECVKKSETINDSLEKFFRRENVGEIAVEISKLKDENRQAMNTSEVALREVSNYKTQLKSIDEYIDELRSEDRLLDDEAKKNQAADETLTDNRRRQERLRELISEERLRLEINTKLEVRRSEMQRLARLLEKNVASREDFERARSEVHALEAQIKETNTILQWKSEVERIDKVVVPKGATKNQGSTAIQQIIFKRLELRLMFDASKQVAIEVDVGIEKRKVEIERLKSLEQKHRSLVKSLESCDAERIMASTQLGAMRQLQSLKTYEFTVTTPAIVEQSAVSSNRKIFLLGITALGMTLAMSVLAFVDLVLWPPADAEEAAWKLGLPIFGRLTSTVEKVALSDSRQREDPNLRLLALRIRQAVPEFGSVILLSTLNEKGGSGAIAAPLARCFASRDERVLILDMAGHTDDSAIWSSLRPVGLEPSNRLIEVAGLHTYLVLDCDDPKEFLFSTSIPNVDCMPAGEILYGMELIATNRMTTLLELFRTRYSLIIAIGPRASHQVDMEMLSCHAGGVIFHANEGEKLCSAESVRIQQLVSLGAPVLGAVLLGNYEIVSPSRMALPAVLPQSKV